MYNGIGLLTPRGSGTSGYVTANKFNLRRAPPPKDEVRKESDAPKQQKPNDEILLHNRKREIEVKLFELRMKLEDADDLDEEQIEKMVEMERTVLEDKFNKQEKEKAKEAKSNTQETHEVARRKLEQMERLRRALRIDEDAKEGEAFDVELQEQRKKERKEKRETMERERRQRAKEEEKGSEVAEEEHLQKHKSHDRSHKSREKRRSRDDRSPERERRPTQEGVDRHREEPYEQSQREDRWLADERKGYDNEQRMISDAEGGMRNAHWSNERPAPRYRTMSYEQPYYQPRFNNHYQHRGGFHQRRPSGRGRGRGYFGGRNFGYYRKDEVAPERYNPMDDDPSDAILDRRQEDWDRQDRWPKSNLDADLQQRPSKEQPVYFDTRANVHSQLEGRDVAVEERTQAECGSPVPHSPTSIKHSPTNPRCFRRSLHHRSRPPSPLSPGATPRKSEAKETAVENGTKSKSVSPKPEKSSVPRQREDKGDTKKRTTSASSGYSSSSKSSSRSGSSSSRSGSSSSRSRSPRRRSRRDLSPSSNRRPPWRDSRPGDRRFGSYGRGRFSDSYRGNGRFRRSYSGAGYGSRRGGGYRYNGRDERRRRSRSGRRRKRSKTRSTSSSGSFSSRDRSRSSSKDNTHSKGDHKDSKAPPTNPTRT